MTYYLGVFVVAALRMKAKTDEERESLRRLELLLGTQADMEAAMRIAVRENFVEIAKLLGHTLPAAAKVVAREGTDNAASLALLDGAILRAEEANRRLAGEGGENPPLAS